MASLKLEIAITDILLYSFVIFFLFFFFFFMEGTFVFVPFNTFIPLTYQKSYLSDIITQSFLFKRVELNLEAEAEGAENVEEAPFFLIYSLSAPLFYKMNDLHFINPSIHCLVYSMLHTIHYPLSQKY